MAGIFPNSPRVYTVDYYSAVKRKALLTQATTRMNLEDIR